MKTVFTFLICFNCIALLGQTIELFAGPNKNIFFNSGHVGGHFNSSYISGSGFTAGVGIDSVKVDWMTVRFTLQFDNYGGELEASDGGLGGGSGTLAIVNKSILSLGLFPLNFSILKMIDFSFGFEISRLIQESFSGTIGGWMMGKPNWSDDLKTKYSRFSSPMGIGLKGRISYDFPLTKSIDITPQYSYYRGISSELREFPEQTRSMRHYFCIGLKKKFGSAN